MSAGRELTLLRAELILGIFMLICSRCSHFAVCRCGCVIMCGGVPC